MNNDWQNTLINHGAEYDQQSCIHFGNRTRELRASKSGQIIAERGSQGLIQVRGKDRASFLQGQITNDINNIVGQPQSMLAAVCNHKGRTQSLFRVFERDASLWLSLPAALIPATLDRLRLYVLSADVQLEDASSALHSFGLSGPKAADALKATLGQSPEDIDQCLHHQGISAIHIRAAQGMQRFELYGEAAPLSKLYEQLNVDSAPTSEEAWRLTDCRAGLPQLYPQTCEAFIPQMLNLQAINGIAFDKGCYTGQEVIARMQYRGELKRHMVIIESQGQPLKPGDELHIENNKAAIGKVVDMVENGANQAIGLAVIRKEHQGKALLGPQLNEQASITTQAPPYPLDA